MGKTLEVCYSLSKGLIFQQKLIVVGCGRVLRDARKWNCCLTAEMVVVQPDFLCPYTLSNPFVALLPPGPSTRQITFLATAGEGKRRGGKVFQQTWLFFIVYKLVVQGGKYHPVRRSFMRGHIVKKKVKEYSLKPSVCTRLNIFRPPLPIS